MLPEDRARGVALVDIGAHSTEIVVYDGDAMLRASSIPVSGDFFTSDVAFGMTVSFEDAEALKREYGCAILGLTSDNSLIEVPSPEGRAPREAPRRLLNDILEARAEELFLYVRNELARVGMDQQLLEGIILTGGGAMLNGMCDMAERVVNCPARNGLPQGIAGWPDEINDAGWCVAAGLPCTQQSSRHVGSGRNLSRDLWDWCCDNGSNRRSTWRTTNRQRVLRFEIQEDEVLLGTRIKVIGVGGGGGNAVARMMNEGLTGVEFHVLNTDLQALQASPVPNKLAIGRKVTNGLGAGADPSIGRLAALEDTERIIELLEGADMVFVTAGLGGGTGTGAAPVIASLAKELNALTVAVVTKPFGFEGPRRMKAADKGLADLAASVDIVITIPNDKLLNLVPKGTSFSGLSNRRRRAPAGGTGHRRHHHYSRTDQPRLLGYQSIMLGMGFAMMGSRAREGRRRTRRGCEAGDQSSPLLEEGGVKGARGHPHQHQGFQPAEPPRGERSLRADSRCRRVRRSSDQFRYRNGRIARRRSPDHRHRHWLPAHGTAVSSTNQHRPQVFDAP